MNAHVSLGLSLLYPSLETRRALFARIAAQASGMDATAFCGGIGRPQPPGCERALAKNQLLVVPNENARLTCLEGEVWLTRDRDIEDYILGPGESLTLRRGDQAVVHALKPSRVRLTSR